MSKELELLLAEYLGQLLHQSDNTFDWIEKDAITRKINAVNELLGIAEKRKTFMDAIKEISQQKF